MKSFIVLFGESQKGSYKRPYFLYNLPELTDKLGHLTEETSGLKLAVQMLMNNKNIIYFRVEEEGFSSVDYQMGYKELAKKEKIGNLEAICLPGVGKAEILDGAQVLCYLYKCIIISTEKDFYDYLTT